MSMSRIALTWFVALTAVVGFASTALALDVVATTTIVADAVRAVAGEDIDLVTLLPANADPHAFQATPNDLVALSNADVVFINGADLEADFADILATTNGLIVDLSTRLALRESADLEHHHDGEDHEHGDEDHEHGDEDHEHGDEEHAHADEEHSHGPHDPHVWLDPTYVMIWTSAIEQTLSEMDPENAARYASRAAEYRAELADLDLWIWEQIGRIPTEQRNLVTDHLVFGYYAARYGLRQVGAILPSFSSLAEPSAQEIAELLDTITALNVPAIFVGKTVSPVLAETIATDTGTKMVVIYTGALSEKSGPAATYLEFMRFNTKAFVDALVAAP